MSGCPVDFPRARRLPGHHFSQEFRSRSAEKETVEAGGDNYRYWEGPHTAAASEINP